MNSERASDPAERLWVIRADGIPNVESYFRKKGLSAEFPFARTQNDVIGYASCLGAANFGFRAG